MAPQINWYYHRNGCKTCLRMQAYLDEHGIAPQQIESANKVRYDFDQAKALLAGINRIVSTRGKSATALNLKGDAVDDAALEKAIIGPSGKFRSPAIKVGKTLLIGFHETAFDEYLL